MLAKASFNFDQTLMSPVRKESGALALRSRAKKKILNRKAMHHN
jgi:hypothetical protein